MSEPGQFTLDPAMAHRLFSRGQAQHELLDGGLRGRASGPTAPLGAVPPTGVPPDMVLAVLDGDPRLRVEALGQYLLRTGQRVRAGRRR